MENQPPLTRGTAAPRRRPSLNTILGIIAGCLFVVAIIITVVQTINHSRPPKPSPTSTPVISSSSVTDNLETAFLALEPAQQNLIYSPLSIKYGLSLLAAGAEGETAEQITGLLGDDALPKYENVKDKLSLANAVFLREDFQDNISQSYLDAAKQKYDAAVITDPFHGPDNINHWISDQTFGLLPKVLGPESITPDTQMALVNALAIDMSWALPFNQNSGVSPLSFYLADGTEQEVKTLHQEAVSAHASYAISDQATVLGMDLEQLEDGTELEFVAIQPSEQSLSDFVSNLSLEQLETLTSDLIPSADEPDGIYLQIPAFKFDYTLNFEQDLMDLGMETAFSSEADFSRMVNIENPSLHVGSAVHKALIECSDSGIKAAAATVFLMDTNSVAMPAEVQPVPVIIDHPFLFLIRDKATGDIWFIGTVYNPES